MFENKTEAEARKEILDLVAEYADKFHNQKRNSMRETVFRTRPVCTTAGRW